MARKPHSKSRRGCLSCKKRHVKCDEQTPRCGACGRLGLQCSWTSSHSNNRGSGSPSVGTPTSSSSTTASDLPIADLQLLAFYILNTATTLSIEASQHIWQKDVVDIAFREHFLLHGILGAAAIHKATTSPNDCDSLLLHSSAHMDAAIGGLRERIECRDSDSAVAVFAMSALVVVHSMGMAQIRPPADPLADLGHWIRLVQGQKATVQQNWVRLLTSKIAPLMLCIDLTPKNGPVAEVLRLKELVKHEQITDPELEEAYNIAIDQLHAVFVNVHYHMKTGQMYSVAITMTWAATLPRVMVDLLLAGDQIALVIFAYFAVQFRLQESSWWMNGWANWTMGAIRPLLQPDYLPWIDWPLAQLGLT